MLAKEVLTEVRYILSDSAKDRWTDERLLILLNDGILDIAKNTTLFIETIFYVVTNLVVDIDMSALVIKFARAEYLDEPLPFYSFDEMDKKDKKWQTKTGDKVEALVYDHQRAGVLKQYPIVSNAQNPNILYSGAYGIITYISYSDILPEVQDTYGDLGEIPDDGYIKFYYVRKHAKVTDINTTLEIDDLIKQPLIHYIAGMAFRDNQDTQSRGQAAEELSLYSAMTDNYSVEKSQSFSRAGYSAGYRPND